MTVNLVADSNLSIFYKIKDKKNKTRGYVYGTAHKIFNDPDFSIPQRIKHKLDKSSCLVLEADIIDELKDIGTKDEIIEKIKQINSTLQSMDLDLLVHAYDAKKTIRYLENIEDQKQIIDAWKEEFYKNITAKVFRLPMNEKYMTEEEKKFSKEYDEVCELMDIAHKTTDEAIVDRVARRGCSEEFYVRFNNERNEKIADKGDSMLRAGDKPFIAIGAGHTVSEAGVVNLLRKKGWTLEKQV